ncbi:MAG: CoA transferase [Dehalococcoidia bacterium]|nr:CoA transferase [Dehalococcoidia bacterium]
MKNGPLNNIRVLEFSLIVAGPFLGMNLADLGADVIKVEPLEGEARRQTGTIPGTSKIFQWVNRGKRTLQINLKHPLAKQFIHEMIKSIDVVVINYRPGVPKRLGIDYPTLASINPQLIYANISGFGSEGPLANDSGADMTAQAYSGAMAADGKIDQYDAPEMIAGISLGDTAAGLGAAMGVCAALFHREKTGEGQYLESSLVGGAMALEGGTTMREAETDKSSRSIILERYKEIRDKGGNYKDLIGARKSLTPLRRGMNYWCGYNAKDGALVISANTVGGRIQVRESLGITGMGDDDLNIDIHDPNFLTRVEEEHLQIANIIRTKTVSEWMQIFRKKGAPVAPVLLPEEVSEDEQGKFYFQELMHSVTGAEKQVKPIVSFSVTPSNISSSADMPGDHVEEILREYGLSSEQIQVMKDETVINE